MGEKRNYFFEAFKTIPNLIFLAAGVLASATFSLISAKLGAFSLIGTIGSDLLVVALVGSSSWFQRRVRRVKGWGGGMLTLEQREKLASALEVQSAERYATLRRKYREIEKRVEEEFSGDPLIEASVQKIEGLIDWFLKFIHSHQMTAGYLAETDQTEIHDQIAKEQKATEGVEEQVAQMRQRNIESLQRRLEKLENASAEQKVIEEQLHMIEISVDAIHGDVMTLNRFTEIGSQIDLIAGNLKAAEKRLSAPVSSLFVEAGQNAYEQSLRSGAKIG